MNWKKVLAGVLTVGVLAGGALGIGGNIAKASDLGGQNDGHPDIWYSGEYYEVQWQFVKGAVNNGDLQEEVDLYDTSTGTTYEDVPVEFDYPAHPYYPAGDITIEGTYIGEDFIVDEEELDGSGVKAINIEDKIVDRTDKDYNCMDEGGSNSATEIAMHWTGTNQELTAEEYAERAENMDAGAHYYVDENEIVQIGEHDEDFWHADCDDGNHNSVGIEMVNEYRDEEPGTLLAQTYFNSLSLAIHVAEEEGISPNSETVKRHHDYTGKICPAWWTDEGFTADDYFQYDVEGDDDYYNYFIDRLQTAL